MSTTTVGGGTKKILYALRTAQRIGLKNSAKALTSKNACKACALGMGGQAGGMTDELGEFPSVCNKSIQAQSTDIQPPIPHQVLAHPLSDFAELSGHELEHLGRLGTPLHKAPGDDRSALAHAFVQGHPGAARAGLKSHTTCLTRGLAVLGSAHQHPHTFHRNYG